MAFSKEFEFMQPPSPEGDGMCTIFLPYSDLKRWIPDEGLYRDICEGGNVSRLSRVRQLSNLAYIGPDPDTQYMLPTNHDRFDHTLTVASTVEYILRKNGFGERDINLGVASAIVHDTATPAHGDPTMRIDPENLDEETHLREAVSPNFNEILNEYSLDFEEVENVVKNEGVIRQTLDIADRITYVMKDLYNCGFNGNPDNRNRYNREISRILWQYPKIGNIYKDVVFDSKSQNMYFNNPERLSAFLKLRALISSKMYFHPISQGRDLLYVKMIEPFYSPNEGKKPLSPKVLRKFTDYDLDKFLYARFGNDLHLESSSPPKKTSEYSFDTAIVQFVPDYEKFKEINLNGVIHSLHEKNNAILGVAENKGFKTGTGYLTKDKNGKLVPFKNAKPHDSEYIQQLSDNLKGTFIYFINRDKNPIQAKFVDKINSIAKSRF